MRDLGLQVRKRDNEIKREKRRVSRMKMRALGLLFVTLFKCGVEFFFFLFGWPESVKKNTKKKIGVDLSLFS